MDLRANNYLQTVCADCRGPIQLRVDGPKNGNGVSICDKCAATPKSDLRARAEQRLSKLARAIGTVIDVAHRVTLFRDEHHRIEQANMLRTLAEWRTEAFEIQKDYEAALLAVQQERQQEIAQLGEQIQKLPRWTHTGAQLDSQPNRVGYVAIADVLKVLATITEGQ